MEGADQNFFAPNLLQLNEIACVTSYVFNEPRDHALSRNIVTETQIFSSPAKPNQIQSILITSYDY